VEREDPHPASQAGTDELLHALGHLARGLVGEGDREDLERADPVLADQVRDPMGEGPGLAAPGAGDDQDGSLRVQDGLALDVVERFEQRRRGPHKRSVGTDGDGADFRRSMLSE
jgi:hypothetical protein